MENQLVDIGSICVIIFITQLFILIWQGCQGIVLGRVEKKLKSAKMWVDAYDKVLAEKRRVERILERYREKYRKEESDA